jgi:hypothetical protein
MVYAENILPMKVNTDLKTVKPESIANDSNRAGVCAAGRQARRLSEVLCPLNLALPGLTKRHWHRSLCDFNQFKQKVSFTKRLSQMFSL